MTFGEKLQALRQRAGMSQDTLGGAAERQPPGGEPLGAGRDHAGNRQGGSSGGYFRRYHRLSAAAGGAAGPVGGQAAPQRPSPGRTGHHSRLGYLAKTKGYLLGWVLIAWGVLDLVTLVLMGLGVLNFMFW